MPLLILSKWVEFLIKFCSWSVIGKIGTCEIVVYLTMFILFQDLIIRTSDPKFIDVGFVCYIHQNVVKTTTRSTIISQNIPYHTLLHRDPTPDDGM